MDCSEKYSASIKAEALRLGFSDCGISKAKFLEKESEILSAWLKNGYHAGMNYMARNIDKRSDPCLLAEDAKSVISVILNYYPHHKQNPDVPQIAKYAYGQDYHSIVKKKLNLLLDFINKKIAPAKGRGFIDTAPVLERAWAQRAGLGWIGKNTNLISKKYGSFIFIGELITDIELDYDKPARNHCGTCNLCIQACPTKAIVKPYMLNSNKCISYLTIENKNEIPVKYKGKLGLCVFGCDICQNVCPWNKKNIPHTGEYLLPVDRLFELTKEDFSKMTEAGFNKIFQKTCLKRSKFKGFKRNLDFISES